MRTHRAQNYLVSGCPGHPKIVTEAQLLEHDFRPETQECHHYGQSHISNKRCDLWPYFFACIGDISDLILYQGQHLGHYMRKMWKDCTIAKNVFSVLTQAFSKCEKILEMKKIDLALNFSMSHSWNMMKNGNWLFCFTCFKQGAIKWKPLKQIKNPFSTHLQSIIGSIWQIGKIFHFGLFLCYIALDRHTCWKLEYRISLNFSGFVFLFN